MRILISADMEGVTGVTFPDDVEPGSARWSYHRTFFTGDVNVIASSFFASGLTADGTRVHALPRQSNPANPTRERSFAVVSAQWREWRARRT